jgi:hypothetical protein
LARVGFIDAQAAGGEEVERAGFEAAFGGECETNVSASHKNKKALAGDREGWTSVR